MEKEIRKPQVNSELYLKRKYNHRVRWMNFWHQIDMVSSRVDPGCKILEIGKGSGLVSDHLGKMGYTVRTLDIDSSLAPDILASVEKMPVADDEFDVVLSAEVLEHLPFDRVPEALAEIKRVTKKYAVVSLPYAGSRFFFYLKIPKLPIINLFVPIPYFWKKHKQTREHYWEVGKKGFPVKKIKHLIKNSGFVIKRSKVFYDDFDHIFFVLKKDE